MRTITLEEHFATPRFLDGPGRDPFNNARAPQLCDLGDKRIAEMDAAGIDMQIVSLAAPGVEQLEAAEAIALAKRTTLSRTRSRSIRRASAASRRCRPHRRTRPPKSSSAAYAVRNSPAPSSTATTAAAISTIDFSGRSWKVPNSSARRSTYIQRGHRNQS